MKKQGKKLKLKKETLDELTRYVVGAADDYPTEYLACAGSLGCPPPNCPSAPYRSCAVTVD